MHEDRLEKAVKAVEISLAAHDKKLADLEDRSRRSNLVVFGIPESCNENESVLRSKVLTDVFEKMLDVSCVSVARIHRLGRIFGKRPVILYFQDYNEKQAVLRNSKKLKGSKIFVQNDYSSTTLRKTKLLWESARHDKASGRNVFLFNDKLKIDNDTYIWDDIKGERSLLPFQGDSASVRE